MKLQEVMSKQQLKNMSTVQLQKGLYNDIADMYNNPDWIPMSRAIMSLSQKLSKSFPLRLLVNSNNGVIMIADQIKYHWVNAKGEYKRSLANWKQSRNEDGNYRIPMSQQSSTSIITTASEAGKFCSDDRQAFLSSILMSYF
jgi:hypothetical protein